MKDMKYDDGKSRVDLVEPDFILGMGKVMKHGALVYKEYSWRTLKNAKPRYYAAALRHVLKWWAGEKNDKESGKHHLLHAACCLMFLFYFDGKGK